MSVDSRDVASVGRLCCEQESTRAGLHMLVTRKLCCMHCVWHSVQVPVGAFFAETVMIRVPIDLLGFRKKLGCQWIKGVWVGRLDESDVLALHAMVTGRSLRRLAAEGTNLHSSRQFAPRFRIQLCLRHSCCVCCPHLFPFDSVARPMLPWRQ